MCVGGEGGGFEHHILVGYMKTSTTYIFCSMARHIYMYMQVQCSLQTKTTLFAIKKWVFWTVYGGLIDQVVSRRGGLIEQVVSHRGGWSLIGVVL